MNDVVCYIKIILTNHEYALIVFSSQLTKLCGIFMFTLKRVHGLVSTAQNKRILWRSMFWTLLVTRVVRACSYETIPKTPIAYIHEVMNAAWSSIRFRFESCSYKPASLLETGACDKGNKLTGMRFVLLKQELL